MNSHADRLIFGIESSCDECSASVVRLSADRRRVDVLSVATFSQVQIHAPYGGVVPEIASRNHLETINAMIEQAGLRIVAQKRVRITREQAQTFYAVHRERPFFGELCEFMISGPVMVQVLEGEGAILKNRDLMGATDPKKADKGTIRADFADSIDANAVHGSDAAETAAVEIAFFFPAMNIHSR